MQPEGTNPIGFAELDASLTSIRRIAFFLAGQQEVRKEPILSHSEPSKMTEEELSQALEDARTAHQHVQLRDGNGDVEILLHQRGKEERAKTLNLALEE